MRFARNRTVVAADDFGQAGVYCIISTAGTAAVYSSSSRSIPGIRYGRVVSLLRNDLV